MKQTTKQNLLEQSVYWTIWLIVCLFPFIGQYYDSRDTASAPDWLMLYRTWLRILPFFLLFIANNYLLAPRLLLQKRYLSYVLSVLAVIAFLFLFYPSIRQHQPERLERPDQEMTAPERPAPPREPADNRINATGNGNTGDAIDAAASDTRPPLPGPAVPQDRRAFRHNKPEAPTLPFDNRKPTGLPVHPPLMSFFQLITAFLLVGFNIAIKLLFKSIRDDAALKEMEHRRLQSELEYLKYQINPHFFMNTLNNIHALMDIDTDKAKTTLVELSKLMRYVLYEASQQTLLLAREIRFLENYIALMRLRYTEKVTIEVELPTDVPPFEIPPLLFIPFVENAFKHGVSYRQASFIRISIEIGERELRFHCLNSNAAAPEAQHRGFGLENIRKRLELLFHGEYRLDIRQDDASYDVSLLIPLR